MITTGTDSPRGAESLRRRFTARRRWIVATAAIGAVTAGSLAFWLVGGGSGPQTTIVRNGEVWLQGEITHDTCAPSGTSPDTGCSITVNGYEVMVVQGNARLLTTPGTVTGLRYFTDQTGSHADIYAQLVGPHLASILSAPKYYARISG